MKVYLAGDSIVQNYTPEEFIAGWGQYLPFFLRDTEVINYAKGGRSARLFINEGRFDLLFEQVAAGDYVLIEFCHNDDASKEYKTMFNRLTSLGMPDEEGRYPIIPGQRMPKDYLPPEYLEALYQDEKIVDKQAVLNSIYEMFSQYPSIEYYPYSPDGSKGSYKWFLKQFADAARERGATPVFVTAPARTVFDEQGKIKDGAGLHGGCQFAYIRAMRQLADEMSVPLLDLFSYSCRLFERIGPQKVHYLTSIKTGLNKGKWPDDYNHIVSKPETVSEDTHFNKYGACLIAKGLAELLRESQNTENLKDSRNCQLTRLEAELIEHLDCVTEQKPYGLL